MSRSEVCLQICPEPPRSLVHARRGPRVDRPVGRGEAVQVDVVQQRRDLASLSPLLHVHIQPADTRRLGPGVLVVVPLGQPLPPPRTTSVVVCGVAVVRSCLTPTPLISAAPGLLAARLVTTRGDVDLPVLARRSVHAQSLTGRSDDGSRGHDDGPRHSVGTRTIGPMAGARAGTRAAVEGEVGGGGKLSGENNYRRGRAPPALSDSSPLPGRACRFRACRTSASWRSTDASVTPAPSRRRQGRSR